MKFCPMLMCLFFVYWIGYASLELNSKSNDEYLLREFYAKRNYNGNSSTNNVNNTDRRQLSYAVDVVTITAEAYIAVACVATTAMVSAGVGAVICGPLAIAVTAAFNAIINSIESDDPIDNVWLTLASSGITNAGGNSLEVTYYSVNNDDGSIYEDYDSLGTLSTNDEDTWQEDICGLNNDICTLDRIELRVDETDDMCITSIHLRVGPGVTGTNTIKAIVIPSYVIKYITNSDASIDCVWFGDSVGAIGNFYFKWKEALDCHEKYINSQDASYAVCMKDTAVIRYHKMTANGYKSYNLNDE